MHPTLLRLERLGESLAQRPDVVALLGLGSAGVQHARFDDHSDIDFFVVADDEQAKQQLLDDIGWLGGFGGEVAFSFVNDPNGRKALFDDGLFVEYAVFTPEQLAALPIAGERIVWLRPGRTLEPTHLAPRPATSIDTVEFHVDEALTNLFVGLHRELRGERLTAMRFIQVFAVDRALALVRLEDVRGQWPDRDPFEATRRVELARSGDDLPLAELAPGYTANASGAAAMLHWLTSRYACDDRIVSAIRQLLDEVERVA